MTIDTHHHFWRYDAVEFCWIPDEMAAIRRDWAPADLRAAAYAAAIDRVVSVQARQSREETRFLLSLADAHPDLVAGVVGWLPIAAGEAVRLITVEDLLTLRNRHQTATFDAKGRLIGLGHQDSREVMAEHGNVFELYDDKPTDCDAWDVDPFHLETGRPTAGAHSLKIVRNDPLRVEVRFKHKIG